MTVVNVEGAGFGVPGNDKEQEQGLRELDPFFDLRMLSRIQQSLHRSIRATADIVWCVTKIYYWDHIHLSKHWFPPLKCEAEVQDTEIRRNHQARIRFTGPVKLSSAGCAEF